MLKHSAAVAISIVCTPVFAESADWSGIYVGGQFGGGTIDSRPNLAGEDASLDGLAGGLTGGFSLQHGAFVYGLEGDVSLSAIEQNTDIVVTGVSGVVTRDLNWLATLRARAGYARENSLFYVTGGVAFTEFELGANALGLRAADSETFTGFTIGAGYEHSLDRNWSIKVDYLYAGFDKEIDMVGTASNGVDSVSIASEDTAIDDLHIIRAGVNYRF